jgi:predicted hotdog family 3-hydroxylacyl-ACP dehydratase
VKAEVPDLPPIEALVPHRGAMLWLERLVAADEVTVEAEARVRREAWYAEDDGAMPGWIGIELMAQAIAAHAGLRGLRSGGLPKPGVLLGCRAYRVGAPRFAAGTLLRVAARMSFADESGFGAYDCVISDSGGELAAATLKVYEPADFGAFLDSLHKT